MPLVADYGVSSDESGGEDQEHTELSADQSNLIKLPAVQPNVNNTAGTDGDDVLEDFVKKTNYGW